MHRIPARRNPGARDCAATGAPRAREGLSRILNSFTPPPHDHVSKLLDVSASATMSRQVSFPILMT
jgi:hypothetical protein